MKEVIRMNNFESFVTTQRAMWVKRLLHGEKSMRWKLYFDFCFKMVGVDFCFCVTMIPSY